MPDQHRPQQLRRINPRAEICNRLGIPEDSDVDKIFASLDARLAALAYGVPEGMVMMDAAALEALKAEAAAGVAASAKLKSDHRAQVVDEAVAAGKISAGRRGHWLAELNRDPVGAEAALNTFPAGMVPVEQPAEKDDSSTESPQVATSEVYRNWDGFPATPVSSPAPAEPRSFKDLDRW